MNQSKYSALTIICAILMAISIFLPFISATGDVERAIEMYPNMKIYSGLDYTASDMESPSLFKMIQINLDFHEVHDTEDNAFTKIIVYTVILVIASLVAAWFAYKKDPTKIMVFVIIAAVFMLLIIGDADDSNMFDPDSYNYGMGIWVFLASAIVAIVGAVKMKKELAQAKQAQQAQNPYAQ